MVRRWLDRPACSIKYAFILALIPIVEGALGCEQVDDRRNARKALISRDPLDGEEFDLEVLPDSER